MPSEMVDAIKDVVSLGWSGRDIEMEKSLILRLVLQYKDATSALSGLVRPAWPGQGPAVTACARDSEAQAGEPVPRQWSG